MPVPPGPGRPTRVVPTKGKTLRAEPYEQAHLQPLLDLVNLHLSAVVPGWAVTEGFLSRHLKRDAGEFVTDPWVVDRATFCVLEGHRMLAATHLLRYGAGPEVGEHLRDVGEINWFVRLPDRADAASEALSRVDDELSAWGVSRRQAYGAGLPKMPLGGIPEAWPHVASDLDSAGYRPADRGHREVLYGGRLESVRLPDELPVPGMVIRRTVGRFGVRLSALLGEDELGYCECVPDAGRGGSLPALRGWGELSELHVAEEWRNKGVGARLVGAAAGWLRLGGCDRVFLVVDENDEAAGAGRFYRRSGWGPLSRESRR